MENRNCPNCGAPYDIHLNTCPYCNTSYFDMSAIDICSNEPFYLKLKADKRVFTSKVRVKPDVTITYRPETMDVVSPNGVLLNRFITSNAVDIDIGFESVADKNRVLYTLEVEE